MKYTQIKNEIILASKSKVRREILEKNNIKCVVFNSNIDEDPIKESLTKEGASPEVISKNLAEIKATKVSRANENRLVLGADSVIDLDNTVIYKPTNRTEALKILIKVNGKKHHLISSVSIVKMVP
jgi:Nucleotide-binding protein implicated in inhibition of septum formation